MKKIVLTGGGTAGHVTPNIALLPRLRELGYEIHYIGSYEGIESRLIADYDIPYYGIATGKLRRYFDPKNFSDPFRVIKGYGEARKILKKIKPDVVFSKGGFVAVPVVRAAASLKIPCIIHESDMTPGLANKLCIPVRGNKIAGLDFCGFSANKPVLMVIGGSQGAANVNAAVREALPDLLQDFQIVHLCGKGKMDNLLLNTAGYKQFEYIKTELKDLFAMADVVISRAGANAICELLALKKPNILIPLVSGSRGDQVLNAKSFESQGFSILLEEDDITKELLVEKVRELFCNRQSYIETMSHSEQLSSIDTITNILESYIKTKNN